MNKLNFSLKNSKILKPTFKKLRKNNTEDQNNEMFTLWIDDNNELPELQQLSLKSMILTGHNVTLYTYNKLDNVPKGIKITDANKILDKSNIFAYKEGFNKGSYSGFANWFRAKRLYEKGGAWFDCDVLSIKNINDLNLNENIISSQLNPDGSVNPNNAFLKLRKNDKLLKAMINHMEKVRDNVKHGDTGPRLLKSMMDTNYKEYYDYLTNTNFIASINFFDYEDFLKPSKEIVPKLKFEEIWGFHIWNAMFRNNGMEHEKVKSGFYYDLKKAISTSSTRGEYESRIQNIIKN
mgnify:CR=1 FL=1